MVVRETSYDGTQVRIVYSHCPVDLVEEVVRAEITRAESRGYTLEWKLYDHDLPASLGDCLLAARFQPEDAESVMVLPLADDALSAFDNHGHVVRRVHDREGLEHVAEISREIGRADVETETRQLSASLRDFPDEMSVHVAYLDGEPVACGRIYFTPHSEMAELAGGRTKTTHRGRGLFTALVASRLREAVAKNRRYAVVDALPTSEPILRTRGFQQVTITRPFVYDPTGLR
jgi:hypothetical protein